MSDYNNFENGIINNKIYDEESLSNFILELEKKYNVKDEIEFFNNLVNFSENAYIPYHKWFKYREGYSHTLVDELLRRANLKKCEYVLDPFCGSGTTIVEGAINGYSGLGIDINPMSAYISKVKCRSYTISQLENLNKVIEQLNLNTNSYEEIDEKTVIEDVKKYFSTKNFTGLMVIRNTLNKLKNTEEEYIYDFLYVAYLCIIEEVSDRKRDGNGLKTSESKVDDVVVYYKNQLKSMIKDVKEHKINNSVITDIISGSAMDLHQYVKNFNNKTGLQVGAIIYSPPYANSFDYFESYKLEIMVGGFVDSMKQINNYRDKAIKSFVRNKREIVSELKFINDIAYEVERSIPLKEALTGKKDSRTRKVPQMLKGYFNDMEVVIKQSAEVLAKGKRCYIVVDQSSYLGKIVPTDLFLAFIGELHGFKVNEIIVCRNAKTSGQQLSKYPYLKEMLRESIVVLEKAK